MTDEQMRIAVAEALGRCGPPDCTHEPKHRFWNPEDGCCYEAPPDYLNDWNATHSAIASLTPVERRRWLIEMELIIGRSIDQSWDDWSFFADYLLDATQRQWCEAFLRVKGKWEEDK